MKNFAIEYRARKFEEIVGQDTAIKGLQLKIKTDTLSNVLLFKGQTGTGKTTAALLTAMALNCSNRDLDGNPCRQCPSCSSILNLSFNRDVILFDGATLSAKSDVLDLFSLLETAPMFDKNKIFIIEEADQLSESAKNAFLKIFEKKLQNIYFILISMKQNGIPDAIKSRCQVYNFYPLTISNIMLHLKQVLEKLSVWDSLPDDFRLAGLSTIASLSKGSMREALQLLERCVQEKVYSKEEIEKMAQGLEELTAQTILKKILKQDKSFVEDVLAIGDFSSFFFLFYTFVQKVLVFSYTGYSESESEYFNKQLQMFISFIGELEKINEVCKETMKNSYLSSKTSMYSFLLGLLRCANQTVIKTR